MTAKISKPARAATQSGQARAKLWLLEFEEERPRFIEPLMGWTGTRDTRQQIRLWFDSQQEAIAYARREGLAYHVIEPKETGRKSLSYADNFKPSRIGQWTH